MKFSDLKLLLLLGVISLFFMQHTIQKYSVDYGEVVEQYKKPIKYWPEPSIDSGISWKEFEAIDWDSNYYDTQELPEVMLGKSCFLTPNYPHQVRFPVAVAIILNWAGVTDRKLLWEMTICRGKEIHSLFTISQKENHSSGTADPEPLKNS